MKDRRGRRRRSKAVWLRDMDNRELHTLCMVIAQDRAGEGTTARQEWAWDQALIELAYRRSHTPGVRKCTCMLCVPSEHATRRARYDLLWGWDDDEEVYASATSLERREDDGQGQGQDPGHDHHQA